MLWYKFNIDGIDLVKKQVEEELMKQGGKMETELM